MTTAVGFLTSMQKNPLGTIKERMRRNPNVTEQSLTRMEPYLKQMMQVEDDNDLPRGILSSLAWKESRFKPSVINGPQNAQGAQGLMQLVKKAHPTSTPTDPNKSIDYAGKHFKDLLGEFGGNLSAATGAYNAGATALRGMAAGTRPWQNPVTGNWNQSVDYMTTVPPMTRPSTKEIVTDMRMGDEGNIKLKTSQGQARGYMHNITSMKIPTLSEMFSDKVDPSLEQRAVRFLNE